MMDVETLIDDMYERGDIKRVPIGTKVYCPDIGKTINSLVATEDNEKEISIMHGIKYVDNLEDAKELRSRLISSIDQRPFFRELARSYENPVYDIAHEL